MNPDHTTEIGECIFREANDGFLIVDPESLSILDANPSAQRMCGRPRKSLQQLSVPDVLYEEGKEKSSLSLLLKACQTTRLSASTDGFRLRSLRKKDLPVHVSVSRIHTESTPLGLIILRDTSKLAEAIENQRRMELQMFHAQKLESLGLMASGIAHDFNNLLVSMLGNANLIVERLPKDSPDRPMAKSIEAAATQAAELTQQLLTYAGHAKLPMSATSVSKVITDTTALLRTAISPLAIMQLDLQESLPQVCADVSQLRQVIMNLITNASESIGERPGVISVRTFVTNEDMKQEPATFTSTILPQDSYVVIEVEDSGCGMEEDDIHKIFDPFYSTKLTGRGLGLAATLGIIHSHRGAIQVTTRKSHGSRFRIFLPRSKNRETITQPRSAQPANIPGTWSRQILVIDDAPGVRTLARNALTLSGFNVEVAGDGEQGLEIFSRDPERFDLVILDLTMPKMSGQEVLFHALKIRPETRFILTSGFELDEVRQTIENSPHAGNVSYLAKPFRIDDLRHAITQLLISTRHKIS